MRGTQYMVWMVVAVTLWVGMCHGDSSATDCTAAAVRAGSREARSCEEVDAHAALLGLTTKKVGGKTVKAPAIHPNFEFMKGTRWLWNKWREVEFTPEGGFIAPAEKCDTGGNPACTWTATEDHIIVHFGGAGPHTLYVDQKSMSGVRDSDGDAVSAVRVA
eukprot:m.38397 g.38397  ORF g.38397 m.38397 type:complete len:161 (-) comp5657_c0_seq1:104-586(-)